MRKAEASAESTKLLIEGKLAVDLANLKMEAVEIEDEVEKRSLKAKRDAEIAHQKVVGIIVSPPLLKALLGSTL